MAQTGTSTGTKFPTLQEARRASGMTQQQLAERAGLSIATVRDLEQHVVGANGSVRRVRSRTLRTLCTLLGVEGFSDVELRTGNE